MIWEMEGTEVLDSRRVRGGAGERGRKNLNQKKFLIFSCLSVLVGRSVGWLKMSTLSEKILCAYSKFGRTLGMDSKDIMKTLKVKNDKEWRYNPHDCRFIVRHEGISLPTTYDQKSAWRESKKPLMCVPCSDGFFDIYLRKKYNTLEEWFEECHVVLLENKKVDIMENVRFADPESYANISMKQLEEILDKVIDIIDEHPEPEIDSLDDIIKKVEENLKTYMGGRYSFSSRKIGKVIVCNPVNNSMTTHTISRTTGLYNYRRKVEEKQLEPIYKHYFNYIATDASVQEANRAYVTDTIKKIYTIHDFPEGITLDHLYVEVYDQAYYTYCHLNIRKILKMQEDLVSK